FVVWWRATALWGACIAGAPRGDHRHAYLMLAAMVAGNLGILAAAGWVLSNDSSFWLLARNFILWGWIMPIFLIVAHRMIPFFTQSVLPQRAIWRPVQLLYGWLAGCVLLAAAAVAQLPLLSAAVAAAMALAFAYTAWHWAGRPGLKLRGMYGGNRLLAMLHLAFAWLPVALALQALGDLGLPLGSAAAHALGLGFCSTMMVGFVTRVSMGHSGRPLQAGDVSWYLYLGLHGVAALRVAFVIIGGPAALLH